MQNSEAINKQAGPFSFKIWLLLALAGGLFLRLFRLGSKSLWFDEAHGFNVAQQGMDAFWNRGIEPVHPPLFFFLLEQWSKLGDSELFLRLFSASLSFLALGLIYWLCKKLFDDRVALTTTLLLSVNPLIIWYAQELRNYSLILFLGALSTLAIVRCSQDERLWSKVGWFITFTLATTGLAYAHYGTMFFFYFQIALLLILVGYQKLKAQSILLWLAGGALAFGLYWPWLTSPVGSSFYQRLFSGQRVANFPFLYRPLPGFETPILELVQNFAWLLIIIIVLIPVIGFLLTRNQTIQQKVEQLAEKPWPRLAVYTLLCLVLIAFIIPRAFTLKRHLVIFIPYFLMIIGLMWPLATKNLKWLLPVLVLSVIGSLVNILAVPKTEWRDMTTSIIDQFEPGDAILINPRYLIHPSAFYATDELEYINERPGLAQELIESEDLGGYNRIWYIEQTINSDVSVGVQSAVFENLNVVKEENYYRTDLFLLTR